MAAEEIAAVFGEYGLEQNQQNELAALVELSDRTGLDPETLSDKWMQWKLNSKQKIIENDVITLELISRFSREAKLSNKRPKPAPMMMEKAKVMRNEVDFASPASASFAERRDKGRIVNTFGGDIEPTETDEITVQICSDKSSFHYMAQNRREIADIVGNYIADTTELLEEQLKIVDPHPITMPIQETVIICGMILMEGAKGSDGVFMCRDEQEVKLDLDGVESFAIYPGMICGIEGNNPTGDLFIVTRIIEQERQNIKSSDRVVEDTTMLLACGPFFTSDSVSEDPLNDLIAEAASLAPHLVILFGPFLDEKHIGVDSVTSRQLDTLLSSKIGEMEKVGTKVILVPSLRDFFADPVMPTPIIDDPDFEQCRPYFAGDPIAAWANGWHVAGTSNDIILQIMKTELAKSVSGDKFARIGDHILKSGRFMPLTPPPENISLDYGQFDRMKLPWTPNLLITPSDMVPFAKEIAGTLIVNPGRLTKGKGGGSYGIVQLNSEKHKVKIVKI